jgi:hypothetical protein
MRGNVRDLLQLLGRFSNRFPCSRGTRAHLVFVFHLQTKKACDKMNVEIGFWQVWNFGAKRLPHSGKITLKPSQSLNWKSLKMRLEQSDLEAMGGCLGDRIGGVKIRNC